MLENNAPCPYTINISQGLKEIIEINLFHGEYSRSPLGGDVKSALPLVLRGNC